MRVKTAQLLQDPVENNARTGPAVWSQPSPSKVELKTFITNRLWCVLMRSRDSQEVGLCVSLSVSLSLCICLTPVVHWPLVPDGPSRLWSKSPWYQTDAFKCMMCVSVVLLFLSVFLALSFLVLHLSQSVVPPHLSLKREFSSSHFLLFRAQALVFSAVPKDNLGRWDLQ